MIEEIQLEVIKRTTEERYRKCLDEISKRHSEDSPEKLTELYNERDFLEKRMKDFIS
jgi:hypothetical protein